MTKCVQLILRAQAAFLPKPSMNCGALLDACIVNTALCAPAKALHHVLNASVKGSCFLSVPRHCLVSAYSRPSSTALQGVFENIDIQVLLGVHCTCWRENLRQAYLILGIGR